ncbi:hypothetical protein C2E23DRAFT_880809 [Lenzites betulinus]|nr:hypothetical protein C2E23DRAFT_880809 [Lenzites betulinus]
MLWQTFFTCERVEFSHGDSLNGFGAFQEVWKPAKVIVSEITDNKRWLMVSLEHGAPPVVFRVINDAWMLSCDERSLTMLMRREDPASPIAVVHKLRFGVPQDFWMFVAAMCQGRVVASGNFAFGGFSPLYGNDATLYASAATQNVM